MIGKLAGSVFQGSYGGFQIRSRVTPRNPQTPFQQLRRGEFGYITALWRSLTSTDRDSWSNNAPDGMSGFNFFVQSNVNLSLIDLTPIAAYESAGTPDAMPLAITALGNGLFNVQASGLITTVPSDQSLLLFATAEKLPGKIFTSPSQYTPIAIFPEGTDFSSDVDIADFWIDRYGQFTTGKRICISTNLISVVNGARSEQSITCADEAPPITEMVYIATLTQSGTGAPVETVVANTTPFTVTYTRIGAGFYNASLTGTFDKTLVAGGITFPDVAYQFVIKPSASFDEFQIETIDVGTGLHADGILNDTLFGIVYNG